MKIAIWITNVACTASLSGLAGATLRNQGHFHTFSCFLVICGLTIGPYISFANELLGLRK